LRQSFPPVNSGFGSKLTSDKMSAPKLKEDFKPSNLQSRKPSSENFIELWQKALEMSQQIHQQEQQKM